MPAVYASGGETPEQRWSRMGLCVHSALLLMHLSADLLGEAGLMSEVEELRNRPTGIPNATELSR